MSRFSVVILNWNGEKLLKQFLPAVVRHTDPEKAEVIVADNGSTDRSLQVLAEDFPEVKVIRFEKNYGFAAGYNKAIALLDSAYVVLLNSDVEVTSGWLSPIEDLFEKEPEVVAIQPKIKAWKDKEKFEYAGACGGYIDRYGFPFCRGRMLNTTETDRGQYDDVVETFWCSGAALCVKREVYLACGGLDERFFAHMEEIDLCWRMRNQGYVLKVQPASVVYHLGGASLPMNHPRKLFLNYRNNLLMLYKNLDRKTWRKLFIIRLLLDSVAFFIFLLRGQGANASAVFRAYRAFWTMRKEYTPIPMSKQDSCIYKGSVVYAYYIRGIKSYTALRIIK